MVVGGFLLLTMVGPWGSIKHQRGYSLRLAPSLLGGGRCLWQSACQFQQALPANLSVHRDKNALTDALIMTSIARNCFIWNDLSEDRVIFPVEVEIA
jgi:hypothetical protein